MTEALPRSPLDRIFRWSLIAVPFGVLGNLAFAWFATDRAVLASLDDLPRRYLLLALVLALTPWVTNALRILIWARFIGHRFSFRDAFRIQLGAELTSSVFPTSSGGEVFRWGMLLQKGVTPGQAASIVTLGYLEDLAFFAVALPAAAIVSRAWELPVFQSLASQAQANEGRALLVAGGVLLVLFLLWTAARLALAGRLGFAARRRALRTAAKVRGRLRHTLRDFRSVYALVVRRGKAWFALTWVITAVQWGCRYSVATAFAWFLGADVDPVLFFLLQWVIFTLMIFVPTPGASGGAEGAFALVYSALLPAGAIGIATAGWRFFTFYLPLLLGAGIFAAMNWADARSRRLRRKQINTDVA